MPSAVPSRESLMIPTLMAVHRLGGSGSIGEIVDEVIQLEGLSEEQQSIAHLDGPQTELEYQLAWSRTYLKGMGLLTNSARGVWTLTEEGSELVSGSDAAHGAEAALKGLYTSYVGDMRQARSERTSRQDADEEDLQREQSWQDQLLEALLALSPDAFERLSMRLLREADFDSVRVTGGTNDKGIDGVGVYRLGLVTFPVFFQCKRYRGPVGSDAVRDFRGAMAGRGDKGLLITTSTFTTEAKREASREGATPIDLVDGSRLCELLKGYGIGVTTSTVEVVTINGDFFKEV